MNRKFLLAVALVLTIGLGLSSCSSNKAGKDSDKVKILASFNAVGQFAKLVGGEHVDIDYVIPPNQETHDFETTVKNVKDLESSDLFIYNGAGMEHWVDDFIKNKSDIKSVETSKGVNTIKIGKVTKGNGSGEENHNNEGIDPHTWLGLSEANIAMENIKNALVEVDPDNKEAYENNFKAAKEEIEKMQTEYTEKFRTVEKKDFVTGHAAFAYLCREFDLKQVSVQGVFSEGEPSAAELAKLSEYCKTEGIKTIFSETLASPAVSETLAKEAGAKVEAIETFEGSGEYLTGMRENLEKIYQSLK